MQTSLRQVLSAPWIRYKYAPLDYSTCSIRLLRVLPKEHGNDLLRCEMHHADINSTYTCLSYVWGSPKPRHRISVNGKLVFVRENLLHFLQQAAKSHPSQLFWIDALCIDQHSVSERNHQVQQMGLIFHNAEAVISWLGAEQGIRRFLERPKTEGEDFYDFWNSEYWNRAWITQEVILAKRLILMAGDKAVPVNELLESVRLDHSGSQFAHDRFRVLETNAFSTFKGMSLLKLLDVFKLKECERERDRVYSLLAICGEGSDIQVDYDRSHEKTLKHVLRHCRNSLCWCSVGLLSKILKVHAEHGFSQADEERPFAQFTIAINDKEIGLDTLDASITFCSNLLCDQGPWYLLHISPDSSCRVPSHWISPVDDRRFSGACAVSLTDDRKSVTVRMSILTLLNLTRGFGALSVCNNLSGLGLQLCRQTTREPGSTAMIQLFEIDSNGDPDLLDILEGCVKLNLDRRIDGGTDTKPA